MGIKINSIDNQKNKISDGLKIENWEKFFEN